MLFFLFVIIFIAFYIVNASNDPQLRHIDKILVNKNRNYEILYGRDHVIYINTNSLDEAVWVKQALEKNQPGKPVRVINPDDESIRIFSWLADNLGVSERTVQRAIDDLKKLGYISSEHSKIKGEWQLLK